MRFILDKPMEEFVPTGGVNFNYGELKSELTTNLEKYQGMVVTEDSIKEAKKDKAALNKLRTSIEDERKRIKRAWNEPYDQFEIKVKELVAMIDQPLKHIDQQLRIYEDARKSDKRAEIVKYFDDVIGKHKGLVKFEQIENPKWLNASFAMKDVQSEIDERLDAVDNDVLLIPDICQENVDFALDYYYKTLDIVGTKLEYQRYIESQERISEVKGNQPDKVVNEGVKAPKNGDIGEKKVEKGIDAEVYQLDFRVWVTMDQMNGLKQYLEANQIKFGKAE